MITAIMGLISSTGFGALIGVAGAWLTRKDERKQRDQDHHFQIEMAKISLEESKLDREHEIFMADKTRIQAETEGQIEDDLKKTEGENQLNKADADAFLESIKHAGKSTGNWLIDGLQKIMRLVITTYLLVFVTIVSFKISSLVGGLGSLENASLMELYTKIISDMLFLTMVAVGWYFGKRATNRK